MKTKDNWTYICRATMARKYIVASVAMVRITAESLSTLVFRNVHQATTRNADRSRCFPWLATLGIYASGRNDHGCSPSTVPIAVGTGLRLGGICAITTHASKVLRGIGIFGSSMYPVGLVRVVERATVYFVTARAPKYNPINLFLRVNAYTLR